MKKYICIQDYSPRWEGIIIPKGAVVMVNLDGYTGIGSYRAIYENMEFSIAGFDLSSHFINA